MLMKLTPGKYVKSKSKIKLNKTFFVVAGNYESNLKAAYSFVIAIIVAFYYLFVIILKQL